MEKTEKPNANFNGRPSTLPGRPKLLTLAITGAILGAGFGAIGVAQAVDRTTEYDEKRHTRQNVWEVRQYDQEPSSVTGLDEANPAPPVAVDRNNNVSMDTLYRRLEANKDNTGFGTFLNQVDRYEEEDIPEWDRRITALEDMEYWEAAPPETTDWITTGRLQETPWEPPTTGMTSDFTQTRWVRLAQERRTHQQERNLDTGELRTVSTSVETRAEDIKESRQVKVTSTPETMVRSGYGCTEFLPKADTVAKGTTFDQSRTCYNDYEKHIYYLVNGTVIDSDTRLRTEAYEEWNYNVAGTYVEPFTPGKKCSEYPGAKASAIIAYDPERSTHLNNNGWTFIVPNAWNYFIAAAQSASSGRFETPTDKDPDNPNNGVIGFFPGPVHKEPNTGAGPGYSYYTCTIRL